MDRRHFLQLSSAACLAGTVPQALMASPATGSVSLTTKASTAKIVGSDFPATAVWGFNGQVPGVPLRVRRGDTLDAVVANELDVPTSVHWHGIRLPNAMDGVSGLTQKAILPGESFHYTFAPPDAGTYWYHSHTNAYEQVARGLYGSLIVEDDTPPTVDRDLIWMIDDWRLQKDASIQEDFGAGHDRSHAGRIGNVPTVNGRYQSKVSVRSGERIRLRLINAANARNFALTFGDLEPMVIAVDGQAITPYQATDPIVIGAAGRVDVIIDMMGKPGSTTSVSDNFYRQSFELTSFVYTEEVLREQSLETSIALVPAQIPEPDLNSLINQDVVIAGGAMGGLKRAKLDGQWMGLRDIAQQGFLWAINDTVANKLDMPPLLDVKRGTSIRLTLSNRTAFPHPMHLHGHHMKLLSINGSKLSEPHWVDSPLLLPNQEMELAFVADNPGDWLFHCHALEHHVAGLGALVRVS